MTPRCRRQAGVASAEQADAVGADMQQRVRLEPQRSVAVQSGQRGHRRVVNTSMKRRTVASTTPSSGSCSAVNRVFPWVLRVADRVIFPSENEPAPPSPSRKRHELPSKLMAAMFAVQPSGTAPAPLAQVNQARRRQAQSRPA
jgi:hypothetical protein